MRAADIARGLGAADLLGRAALGYGGQHAWFRAGKDRRLIPLLEDALEAQPKQNTGIRSMLLARLAGALRDHRDHERRLSLAAEAVDIARRLGDLAVLAWAIEGSYASISWPRDSDRWLSMARELREVAEQLGDMENVFSGHLHAFSAYMVRGDVDAADRELAAAEAVARDLRQPLSLWLLPSRNLMRALHAGRFEEAERLVGEELSSDRAWRATPHTSLSTWRSSTAGHSAVNGAGFPRSVSRWSASWRSTHSSCRAAC